MRHIGPRREKKHETHASEMGQVIQSSHCKLNYLLNWQTLKLINNGKKLSMVYQVIIKGLFGIILYLSSGC